MSIKLILSALLLVSISQANHGLPVDSKEDECSQAADIVFIVDTSSSIWSRYYGDIKKFLKDVIKTFKIGPDPLDSRVGVLTFSTRENLEFHLNRYKTVEDVQKAVDNITFFIGNTYTHKALEYASKEMLTQKNGARDDVNKVVVVLTDGRSAHSKKTADSATTIKNLGAGVFAIGVGTDVDFQELYAVASRPKEHFVFSVSDYRALDSIKKAFAQKACHVLSSTTVLPTTTVKPATTASTTTTTTATPTTSTTTENTTIENTTTENTTIENTTTENTTIENTTIENTTIENTTTENTTIENTTIENTTTTARPTPKHTTKKPVFTTSTEDTKDETVIVQECSTVASNVVFVYDNFHSIESSKVIVQKLITDFVNDIAINASHIKVGILTQPCTEAGSLPQSVSEFRKSVASIRARYTISYSDIVKQLRTEMFTSVPLTEHRVAVLVVDEMTGNLEKLQKEVKLLQMSNTKIIVVAVGKVEEAFLETLVAKPVRDHVLRVDSYSQMQEAKLDVLGMVCDKNASDIARFEPGHLNENNSENSHSMHGQVSVDENQNNE